MSKAAIVLVLLGLLAVGAAGLWYFYPGTLRPLVADTPMEGLLSTSTPVFQWRDAQGHWRVTDEPPQGKPYEVKQYDLDVNILPSFQGADE